MSEVKSPSGSLPRKLVVATLVLAAIGGIWWKTHHSADAQEGPGQKRGGMASAIGVAVVKRQDAPLQLGALGTVTSAYTVTVRSRVDGQLDKLHFTEGQLVKQGQLLAELDPRPYQAALTQVEGQLLRDQALLKNAELDLQRYKQLLAQNSIAKQQVDTQEALVQQYAGTVKLDQGAVDNARLQLSYSRVVAPITGTVGLRQVDPGNIVHASDTNGIVVITQTQPVNVVFAIPETSLSQVLQARQDSGSAALAVEAWDREDLKKIADGKVLAIDNQLNVSTGTVNIKASFDNSQNRLFPNQFVNAHLQLGVRKNAVVVPTVAIQLGKQGNYVYTVNADETVSLSKVKPGPVSGDSTVIEEGLEAGQKVAIDGLDKLRDGAKVKVIDRSAKAADGGNGGKGAKGGNGERAGHKADAATGPAAGSAASAAK